MTSLISAVPKHPASPDRREATMTAAMLGSWCSLKEHPYAAAVSA